MKFSPVPVPAPTRDSRALLDALEALQFTTTPKLALLIQWSDAEAQTDRGGSSLELEQLAWHAMRALCRDVLRDVEEVLKLSGAQKHGFVMLPNDEGAQ